MAVNSFVENVNKLAISLYGDGTTPVDVSIITNNIEAITFLYDYISNGGEFGTIGASTVIENVSVLPSVSTEGTIVYLNTNNKLYVYNGASWDEVGGGTIESTGGSITVVSTKPASASVGDIIYLTTDGFLYTWDGTAWDKVGSSTVSDGDSIFVTEKPTSPSTGDKVLNILDGSVSTWDGTQWVVEEYTPHASSMTAIKFVTALPLVADSKDGDLVYNETNGITYIFKNGAWVNLLQDLTPNASGTGIEIVAILPLTVTNGKVLYNSANKKLYEGVNGSWVPVVEATTAATDVADASITVAKFAAGIKPVEVFGTLPQTGNSVGRIIYNTTDGQLYRYTASGFTTAVPAQAITGTIGATQIAPDAITTEKIAAGAITADEIGANAITAGKIAVNAVTAGTIQAGAVRATEIASNAITTDKIYSGAITAVKLSANSVDATKIVAGSITASLISADAINAGHIQAGAIGASEISAGAITADKIASKSITAAQIQAGAISASEIASNAITATHILAGAITASKLSVDALDGKSAAFTGSRAYGGDGYWTITANAGIHSMGSRYALVGQGTGAGTGVMGHNSSGSSSTGVMGYVSSGSGVAGESASGVGVLGKTTRADKQWGFLTYEKSYAGGGFISPVAFNSFTGAHIAFTKDNLNAGDIVCVDSSKVDTIDQSIILVSKSSSIKSKAVMGVYSNNLASYEDMFKESSHAYIQDLLAQGYKIINVNSLGEGAMIVSDKGGNIAIGDYICTSSLKGKGMKQDDDILHNYTVAKALESVDWSKETTTSKMIACTYHAG